MRIVFPKVMDGKLNLAFFILFMCPILLNAHDWEEEEKDSSYFFYGVQVGAFFPNNNTAELYSGAPSVTNFGIDYILSIQQFQQEFNDYFRFPYYIAEYPIESRYQTSFEIGINLGYQFNKSIALFADLNAYQLSYEQFFTMGIENPLNQSPQDDFERLPILGKESRFHLNLGTQISYYNTESINAYIGLFGNVNDVELRRNYIIINNREYDIFLIDINNANQRPGGIGFGGGATLGLKFVIGDHVLGDFYYTLLSTQTNMLDNMQPRGLHHSIGFRVLWH